MNPDCTTLMELVPAPFGIVRLHDLVLVHANSRYLHAFKLSREQVGEITVKDLVSEVYLTKLLEDLEDHMRNDYPLIDRTREFRRTDGSTFIGWSRSHLLKDEDGVAWARATLIFDDIGHDEMSSKLAELVSAASLYSRASLAAQTAHEMNNSLTVLGSLIESIDAPKDQQDRLIRAFDRTRLIGQNLVSIGQLDEPALHAPHASSTRGSSKEGELVDDVNSVLIIDDEDDVRTLISQILEMRGFTCHSAANHAEAMRVCSVHPIDCAVIDLRLGNEDGRNVADDLVAQCPSIGIVFVTGFSSAAIIVSTSQDREVITKPFASDELVLAIRRSRVASRR